MNLNDYHKDWRWISRQIREQAGNKCEFCGVANHAVGARDLNGAWVDDDEIDNMWFEVALQRFGGEGYPPVIRIVLTVAHLDHDKNNNDPCNLRALCQRCHLNWDRDRHIENRRRNAIARTGQLSMIGVMP